MVSDEIGRVTHYFQKSGVCVVELTTGRINSGDTLSFKGQKTDLTQTAGSMQVDHKDITEAKPGDAVGIKVDSPVHENDSVFLEQ